MGCTVASKLLVVARMYRRGFGLRHNESLRTEPLRGKGYFGRLHGSYKRPSYDCGHERYDTQGMAAVVGFEP